MSNLYKSLIVFTALVSLFFLSKWVYHVWPRYETRETITIFEDYEFLKRPSILANCTYLTSWKSDDECFCQKIEGATACYMSEKVRTN